MVQAQNYRVLPSHLSNRSIPMCDESFWHLFFLHGLSYLQCDVASITFRLWLGLLTLPAFLWFVECPKGDGITKLADLGDAVFPLRTRFSH